MGPGRAAVERTVHPVADRRAVARVALPGAHPDGVRVGVADLDGADRGDRLIVEDGKEGDAPVVGAPHASGCGADDDRVGVRGMDVDRGDPSAHRGRADRAGAQAGEEVRIDRSPSSHARQEQRRKRGGRDVSTQGTKGLELGTKQGEPPSDVGSWVQREPAGDFGVNVLASRR